MSNPLRLRKVRVVAVAFTSSADEAPVINGPEDVAAVARAILPTDREGFIVIHLDSRHAVLSVELVSIGSLNSSIIHPRETFKGAILANAAAIVIAHNHPSGKAAPSEEDAAITRRLVEAGRLIGIEVVDHVVVTTKDYYSFREKRKI